MPILSKNIELLWAGMQQAKNLDFPMKQQGNKKLNEKRIHPTQKPVLLYKKLLLDYAKTNDKILDTHSGSGSLAIACIELGFDYLAIELDKEYFDKSVERVNTYIKNNVCDTQYF